MQLNCDLGELEFPLLDEQGNTLQDTASSRVENLVMPFINQASIACGYHAGNEQTMLHTLRLARQYHVSVGAHPSYPDRENFGRVSMAFEHAELIHIIHQQVETLSRLASDEGVVIDYIKPHGALYNDMMRDELIRTAVIEAVANLPQAVPLVLQAGADAKTHKAQAAALGVDIILEAFADRGYSEDGLLVPRSCIGAVHDELKTLAQVRELCESGAVTTVSGKKLTLQADTLCVHGDNVQAVSVIKKIRALIDSLPHAQ